MKRGSSSVGDKKVAVVHVVLEVGATHVRGGIAGECTPRFVIPTPFHPTPSLTHLSTTSSTGETAMEAMRMNCLEGLRVIFLDYLQIRAKDCSVLVVENMFAPVAFRDQLFNALLNEMQVQAVCFQPDMLMPILATGCQSGVVVDIGSEEIRAVCIAYGRPLLTTFVATPIGVNHAAKRFRRSLNRFLASSSTHKIGEETGDIESSNSILNESFVATLFEKTAVASAGAGENGALSGAISDVSCVFEGRDIVVPGWLRHDCLTSLITGDPDDEDSQDEVGGVLGLILACALKSSSDVRGLVLKNIVLAGGGAQLPGLPEELCFQLSRTFHNLSESKSLVCADNMSRLRPLFVSDAFSNGAMGDEVLTLAAASNLLARHTFPMSSLNWIGGSLFASLKSNRANKYVERDEYLVYSRNVSGSAKAQKIAGIEHEKLMQAPDWLSTNPSDWRFYGPGEYRKADNGSKSTSAGRLQKASSSVGSTRRGVTSTTTSTGSASSFFETLLKKS